MKTQLGTFFLSLSVTTILTASVDGGSADKKFPDTVWRVSWSLSGNILAVSCGDGKVTLWKEVVSSTPGAKEEWE